MGSMLGALASWMGSTSVSQFVHDHVWLWPTLEIIHFIGLVLVVGAAGALDMRLLGFARQIPVRAINGLIPWAFVGLGINVITGLLFVFATPTRFLYNPAFGWKLLFLVVAGVNVLVFSLVVSRKALTVGPGEDAPLSAKVIGATSLVCWFAVMYFGRMLPYLGDR